MFLKCNGSSNFKDIYIFPHSREISFDLSLTSNKIKMLHLTLILQF